MIINVTVVRAFAMLVLALSIPFAGVANAEGEGDHGGPILPINGECTPECPTVEVRAPLSSGFLQYGRRDPRDRGEPSGGGFNGNHGDNHDVKDASTGDPCTREDSTAPSGSDPISGNPIVLSTGDKVERETDFVAAGEMPLSLQRTYNHFWNYPGLFGKYWVSSFDYTLVWQIVGTDPEGVIFAQRPDGRRIKFVRVGVTNRWNENKAQAIAYIVKNADSTWSMFAEDNVTEQYDGGGRPLNVKNAHGIGWTFSYANNYLSQVAHTSGMKVMFTWSAGQLTQVTAPDTSIFSYTYSANAFGSGQHRLASSTTPSAVGNPAVTTTYFYEDARYPGGLTGKAFNGVRYSTFAYDAYARAIKSEHATGGIDRFTYVYNGTPTAPSNPPPNPAPPGSSCNLTTHNCPLPPIIDGVDPDPAQSASDAALAVAEDNLVAMITATQSNTIETNPLGLQTTYTFLDGRLSSVSGAASANCSARSRSRSYDANGNEDLVTDFNGNYTDYNYSANGQLQQVTEAYNTVFARTTTYAWDSSFNRPTSVTVTGDHQTSYTYTTDNRIASVTVKNLSANGVLNQTHTWTYAYTKYPSGIVQQMVTDGPLASDQLTYNYSTYGDLTSVSNALGHTTTYAGYNGLGQPNHMSGPNGDITDYGYYPGGKLKQVTTYPSGTASTASMTYSAGLLATATSADGVTTTFAYDTARRLTSESRPELNGTAKRQIGYNLASNPTEVDVYRDATLRYRAYADYDEIGRIIAKRGNNGENVRYTYYNNDNVKTVTDSLSRVTTLTYDALNRLSTSKDAKLGLTRYEYDAGNRVSKITDPRSLVTSYANDGFGQLWKQVSPDSGTTTYGYLATGLRNSMARANGVSTSYAYDGLGRLASATSGSQVQNYGYDWCINGKGRICNADGVGNAPTAHNSIQYQYELDGRIRVRRDLTSVAGVQGDDWTSFGYDTFGRLIRATYPNGQAVNYGYSLGQINAMTLTSAGVTSNVLTNLSYEPSGPVTGWTYGNGLTRTYAYDLDRRLTSLATKNGASPLQSLSYGYNANDLITQMTNGVNASLSRTYGYDELSRLVSITLPGGASVPDSIDQPSSTDLPSGIDLPSDLMRVSSGQDFVYDANGNRTSSGAAYFTIASTSNRLTGTNALAPSTFVQDGAGNTTSYSSSAWGSVGYNYDGFNRMSSVTTNGSVVGTYGYNGYSERSSKQAAQGNYRYTYDEGHRLLSEHQAAPDLWTNYLWFGGQLVGFTRGTQLYFLHNDHLGRPEQASNSARAVVWQSSNNAFGGGTTVVNTIGSFNIGFPGQYFDSESGLWYNMNRYYDALMGRYEQADPIGLGGGVNPYVYANGNAVNIIDPAGLEGYGSWTLPPGYNAGRGPDFVQFAFDAYVFNVSATFSRSGNAFIGGGITRQYPRPAAFGASAVIGWLNQAECPSGDQVDNFVGGFGQSATGFVGAGGGVQTSPGNGSALVVGIGDGWGVGPGGVSYSQGQTGISW